MLRADGRIVIRKGVLPQSHPPTRASVVFLRTSLMRTFQLALALILLTTATRIPALIHPQPIDDEAIYSVVANEIIDGGKPYLDAVERKPPLLFYTYAAVFKLAGKYNWTALHVVALLWTLATMGGLYVIGRHLFSSRTGFIAALLYSLFQPAAAYKNLGFNGEQLMNLPIVWAWAIAFRSSGTKLRPELLGVGVLSCLAFLLKQPAAIAAVPLGLYFLLPNYRRDRGLTRGDCLLQFIVFTFGFFGCLGVAVIALQHQGTLREAFYWTIQAHASSDFFVRRFVRNTLIFVAASLPLLLGAAWGRDLAWKERPAEWMGLVMLTVASAIGAAAGGRFYSHYYIQLVPPLTLLAAPAYARLSSREITGRRWFLHPAIISLWLVLTIVVFPMVKWRELAVRREPTELGKYLAEHAKPNERLFVWGQMSRIYLEARMRPACRYITTFALTGFIFGGPIPGADTHDRILPGAWETLQEDFSRHPPAFIADTQVPGGAYTDDYAIADFPILNNLLAEKYLLVFQTAEGAVYRRR